MEEKTTRSHRMKFRLLKREMVLSPNDEDSEYVASSKNNIPNSRLECACTSHTLFQTKMVEIDTLVFQTKTAKKTYRTLWRRTYLYSLYKGVPPGVKKALHLMTKARLISPRGDTWVFFGWVCATRASKLAPLSKKNSPKIDAPV